MPGITVILLAAGESTRMGRQKALLPWGDCPTLVEYHLRELASLPEIAEVMVVTGYEPERITEIARAQPIAHATHNPAYKTGKVSSIVAGVSTASVDATALILLAVDQPRSAAVLRTIIDASPGALITVPVHGGRRGHPVVFDASLRDELLAIEEETQGIRAVLQRHAADVREVEAATDDVLVDLNHPEDVAASQGS
jgi:molybdenum cofactor cytidylyltransferase